MSYRYSYVLCAVMVSACAKEVAPDEGVDTAALQQGKRELPLVGRCSSDIGTIELHASDTEQYAIATGTTANSHYVGLAARTCVANDYCNQGVSFVGQASGRTENWSTDSTDYFRAMAFFEDGCAPANFGFCRRSSGLIIGQVRATGEIQCTTTPVAPGRIAPRRIP